MWGKNRFKTKKFYLFSILIENVILILVKICQIETISTETPKGEFPIIMIAAESGLIRILIPSLGDLRNESDRFVKNWPHLFRARVRLTGAVIVLEIIIGTFAIVVSFF